MLTLDVEKAHALGFITDKRGLFRGEEAIVVEEKDNFVKIKLPNSLEPDKIHNVHRSCLHEDGIE